MDIDKSGGDGKTVSLDDLPRIAADFADGNDATSIDRDVSGIALRTGPVVDRAVFDQQIVTHRHSSFFTLRFFNFCLSAYVRCRGDYSAMALGLSNGTGRRSKAEALALSLPGCRSDVWRL